jgi:hypothetical protein
MQFQLYWYTSVVLPDNVPTVHVHEGDHTHQEINIYGIDTLILKLKHADWLKIIQWITTQSQYVDWLDLYIFLYVPLTVVVY